MLILKSASINPQKSRFFNSEEEGESERRTKSVLLNQKGEQRPTKATLKQVNYKIDL